MFILSAYVSCCKTMSDTANDGQNADNVLQPPDLLLLSSDAATTTTPAVAGDGALGTLFSVPHAFHDFGQECDALRICLNSGLWVVIGRVEHDCLSGELEGPCQCPPRRGAAAVVYGWAEAVAILMALLRWGEIGGRRGVFEIVVVSSIACL